MFPGLRKLQSTYQNNVSLDLQKLNDSSNIFESTNHSGFGLRWALCSASLRKTRDYKILQTAFFFGPLTLKASFVQKKWDLDP